MDTTDVFITAFMGAVLALIGLAGIVMYLVGPAPGAMQHPIFDLAVPVLFVLVGIWLFRAAKRRHPVSWVLGLAVALIVLGLATIALSLDHLLRGRAQVTTFGFFLGGFLLAGGLWLMTSRGK
jgi:hypothetical protein